MEVSLDSPDRWSFEREDSSWERKRERRKLGGKLWKNCDVTVERTFHPRTPEGRNEIKVATSYKQHPPLPRTLLHLDDHANERITVSSLTFASALAKARFPAA